MVENSLDDYRVLIVEDDYLVADWLRSELNDAGAMVLGPVATVTDALDLVNSEHDIDAVLLDVGLRAEMAFPVADLLVTRDVPFMFLTGYDASEIPSRFQHIFRHEKPAVVGAARMIKHMIHSRTHGSAA